VTHKANEALCAKEVSAMEFNQNILEKIDVLYDLGRDFVERPQVHGSAVEFQFDTCAFDNWRRKVNDLLFGLGGCDDLSYQRFSKEVTTPRLRDLEQGLRILASVRDDVAAALGTQAASAKGRGTYGARRSASYH
jgi:hypothetical protein